MISQKLKVVGLLALGLIALPANADEKCVASSIDKVGQCPGMPASVQKTIDRELRGTTKQVPATSLAANLLATQITGSFATGEIVSLGNGRTNEWMLITRGAEVNSEGELQDSGQTGRLALIRYVAASKKTDASGQEDDRRPIIEVKALAPMSDLIPSDEASSDTDSSQSAYPDCITPANKDATEADMAGPYEHLAGKFRWLQLSPQHRVIAAEVGRMEGYAGGGGEFVGEILLDVRHGTLRPIACYAVSRYQMFGGAWNPDGTRQHPESYAAWKLVVTPGGEWPQLRLSPTSRSTPSAVLVWNDKRQQYVQARQRH